MVCVSAKWAVAAVDGGVEITGVEFWERVLFKQTLTRIYVYICMWSQHLHALLVPGCILPTKFSVSNLRTLSSISHPLCGFIIL